MRCDKLRAHARAERAHARAHAHKAAQLTCAHARSLARRLSHFARGAASPQPLIGKRASRELGRALAEQKLEARARRVQLLEEDRRRVREEQQRKYIAARKAREKAEAERKKLAQEAAEAEAERLRSEGNPQGFSEPQGGDRDVRPRGSFMGPSAPRESTLRLAARHCGVLCSTHVVLDYGVLTGYSRAAARGTPGALCIRRTR